MNNKFLNKILGRREPIASIPGAPDVQLMHTNIKLTDGYITMVGISPNSQVLYQGLILIDMTIQLHNIEQLVFVACFFDNCKIYLSDIQEAAFADSVYRKCKVYCSKASDKKRAFRDCKHQDTNFTA